MQGPRDTLSAACAHEINNPLQCLLNLLYLVENDPALSKQTHLYLESARDEAQRISEVLRKAMCGPEGEENWNHTNVPKVLRAVVDFYQSRLLTQGISINTRYCPDGDLLAECGPLRQVFSNLLLNAAEATPHGGRVYARVSTAQEWGGEGRRGLRITVADNGCGISAENLPKICQPFYTSKGAEGTGIGLSLVKEVVQRHGGALRVRSSIRAGHSGSVFAIFLPAILRSAIT